MGQQSMGAAKKINHKKVLRDLVPINALSEAHVEEVTRKATIEDIRSGSYVFKKGDRDYQSVYLLDGTVELVGDGRAVVSTIKAGSKDALHPLAHKQPRQVSARAAGKVTVARIDSSLLDVLLTWDESAGYDVVEIDAHDDDDWMTRMLQSQAFLQLPPSNIHQLLMRLESVEVSAGDAVIRQGEEGDYFYIVKNGRLAVTRKPSARGKDVLLAELGEGACFGEEALVSETTRNASVTMLTDGLLMRLSKDDFNELLRAPLVHEVDFAGAQELVSNGAQWLDVRLPGEVENQEIAGSINLPLSALRDQCTDLDRNTPYIVCCDTGRRSAAGAFVLSQRGLQVYTLRNGLMDAPDEALKTKDADKDKATDAEIIPFESEGKSAGESGAEKPSGAVQSQAADTAFAEKLASAEKEIVSLQQRLQREEQRFSETHAALQAAETQYKEQQSGARQAAQQLDELRSEAQHRERRVEEQLAAARQEQDLLKADLAAAKQALEASQSRFDSVDREKNSLQGELSRLKETLAQAQASADGRDSVLRNELEQMAKRLDDQQQTHDRRNGELEQELGRLRDENQQLEQRNTELAGERDATTKDLEHSRQQLTSLQGDLSALQGDAAASRESLQASLEQREGELEEEKNRRQSLEQQLAELDDKRKALERNVQSATERAECGQSRTGELEARLAEYEQRVQELEQSLKDAGGREQVLQTQLEELDEKSSHQLEESLKGAATQQTELNEQIEALQQQLADQGSQLQQQLSEREALEKKLGETEQSLATATELERELQEKLQQGGESSTEMQKALDQALADAEDLSRQLDEAKRQAAESEKKVAQLDSRLTEADKEHASDIASLRDALTRAQDERENVSREQTRLLGSLRKAERDLERERHDHQSEVHRLQKELKETAGGSNAGLAAEVDALQEQLDQAAKLRDELEVQLGERSAQMENAQAEAAKLLQQLDQARESAHQAEQQLIEANQTANEEMTIRLDAEQQAQQALREQLEAATSERDQNQEQLSTLNRELEDLREKLEQAQADVSANKQSAQALQEAEGQVQELSATLQELEGARDEARNLHEQAQREIDELRAEAEVSRGLVNMQASLGENEEKLRQELVEAKKKLELTVRLHTEAEAKVSELRQEVEYLQTEASQSTAVDAVPEKPVVVPSLDENSTSEALQAESQFDVGIDDKTASEIDEQLQSDAVAQTRLFEESVESGKSRGTKLVLPMLLVLVAAVAGGAYWWFTQKPITGASSNNTSPDEVSVMKSLGGDPKGAAENTEQAEVSSGEKAARERAEPPKSVPSFAKGATATPIPVATEEPKMAGDAEPRSKATAEPEAAAGDTAAADADKQAAPVEVQPVRSFSESLSSGGRTPTMVEFRADNFDMGSSSASPNFSERPRHKVKLKRFAMAKNEVTFAQYDKFAEATGRSKPASGGWGRGNRPVINVSWKDASAYAQWLSKQTGAQYRLPTEAEWEFAARAGSEKKFWWGNQVGESRANCFNCGGQWAGKQTAPVGSYPASPYGVHDMAGNVMEWVQDCYRSGYADAPDDGTAVEFKGCKQRVVRGGGFDSPSDLMRSSSRNQRKPTVRLNNLGFRVVREF
jgi:formylglycine-generating enzyme required for sulfatase activity/CRP-like cAMP-binding protein/chromosome segregation ATPase